MTEDKPVTVEEVRIAQESFQKGGKFHENKQYRESIEEFKKAAMTHSFNPEQVEELGVKLKSGSFKLQQESSAYMGCAAVHLSQLVHCLDTSQQEEVPLDESLMKLFKEWE
jgi:hypothetical protein